MGLQIDSFTFHAAGTDLNSTAKRYTHKLGASIDGLTLLFAHGVGAHKEQWDPTIEQIFRLQQSKDTRDRIREAWSFDWQSHGDAAVLNESILQSQEDPVSAVEWALAIEWFVKSHLRGHRIVALGHSAGTAAIILSMKNSPVYKPPYIAVFLIEPTILSQENFNAHAKEREDSANMTMKVTLTRRDSWPDRESAAAYLRSRVPWKYWDSRVFDLYVQHGLRNVTTSAGKATVLKTSKRQEGMAYPQFSPYIESMKLFRERCTAIPFHIIFGERVDFMPTYIQEGMYNADEGNKPATVTRVPNAGHLVLQEHPNGLADAICNQLNGSAVRLLSRM